MGDKNKPIPFLDLGRMHKLIASDLLNVTEDLIGSSQFIMDKHLEEFEQEFSRYVGSKYGVGVASGADALFLVLKAMGIKKGDEVITVNNTFNATVDAIIRTGATPRIIDVNDDTLLMDLNQIKQSITDRTKAIIPVHLYGNPIDMTKLVEIRNSTDGNIRIIQDAAQAHGAISNKKPLGKYGDALCHSFYPSKNLGALGDGGFVASDNSELIDQIKVLRNCGQKEKYNHVEVGFNSRLDNIQAAYLLIKIRKLEEWNKSRRRIAAIYKENLQEFEHVRIVSQTKEGKSVFHLFVIRLNNREKLIKNFHKNNIQFGIHYPIPINKANAYKKYIFSEMTYPISEQAAKEIISIPIFPYMKNEEIIKVIETIKEKNNTN